MPRRKKNEPATETVVKHDPLVAATATLDAQPEPFGADLTRSPETDGEPSAGGDAPKHWGHPYKATFTCPAKRFELGENRRFKQMVFTFAENPGAEVTQKLKDAGFKYRANEKAWTVQVTPSLRELATKLAHELGGTAAGVSR